MHKKIKEFQKVGRSWRKATRQRTVQSGQGCFTDPVYFLLQQQFLDSIAVSLDHREGPMIIHREKQYKTKRANEQTNSLSILFRFGNEERWVCRNQPVAQNAIATPNLERCFVRSLKGYCHFRGRATCTVSTFFLCWEELTKLPHIQGGRRSLDRSTLRNALILSPLHHRKSKTVTSFCQPGSSTKTPHVSKFTICLSSFSIHLLPMLNALPKL